MLLVLNNGVGHAFGRRDEVLKAMVRNTEAFAQDLSRGSHQRGVA
jgi:ABC-type protease/lipase transport system fused ATPase/permease subunit